eukprot:3559659-Pyramimonas_sp.AAC.1
MARLGMRRRSFDITLTIDLIGDETEPKRVCTFHVTAEKYCVKLKGWPGKEQALQAEDGLEGQGEEEEEPQSEELSMIIPL